MKLDKIVLIVFGMLLVIGAAAALFNASCISSPPPMQAAVAVSPKPAPDFELELFSGKTITLKEFIGKKPVVINFWAS